ncbi:gephyrin-like molybdotransferase Glp [Sporosalibacterium faouarense]|uniref:molybdopterin molybdotransferase MoeA n=1 Tax=Sporosalibacterium faouarense TaxID=516123 RepID=UPI00192AED56|nr:gephyrin-like molybdotransferase Glp [Sporosalibacterium faouarense]
MDFFNVISVGEAKERLLKRVKNKYLKIETINLVQALNRVLAEDIVSDINVPEFNRSTVDGYAIQSKDSYGATETVPSLLNYKGEVSMGTKTDLEVNPGEAVYVPTGGMIPNGADSVVMIENAENMAGESIFVYKPISNGENLILKGDDIKKNQTILSVGKKLTPQDIGVLAAIGKKEIKVYKKPRFYVISTGDEIIDLDEELGMGEIRDINGYALYSLIKSIGGEVVAKSIVRDEFDLLRDEVEKGIDNSDVVLISGGSSVGVRDYTYDVINSFDGEGVFIHGISIKPGKPTLVGEANGKIVFGLPGHPVSSIIVFKVLVEHLIEGVMNTRRQRKKTKAILDFNVHSNPGKETYHMVKLEERKGNLYAIPNWGKSGMITLLSESNGYIIISSEEEGINKGDERQVYFL